MPQDDQASHSYPLNDQPYVGSGWASDSASDLRSEVWRVLAAVGLLVLTVTLLGGRADLAFAETSRSAADGAPLGHKRWARSPKP